MSAPENPAVKAYSATADAYDDAENLDSCWGRISKRITAQMQLKPEWRVIADLGCGAGQALRALAAQAGSGVRLLGFEPADEMRAHAASNVRDLPSVEVHNGRFESIPLESDSVDYLYSLIAFHWATDLEASVRELARVLKPGGEMDLYFVGRDSGKNFIQRTSPILMKHLGLGWLVKSAKIRKHLGRKDSEELFQSVFPTDRLVVDESHEVHFDSLEGHWNWWQARLEPHFIDMSPEKREACDQEMLASLAELETDEGVPFDVHLIHVHLDGVSESA